MCVENFKKLNIRSDQGDQISFIFSLQFGRAEFSKRPEHLVTDDRKQSKCNLQDRCQKSIEKLRNILAEIAFQLIHALYALLYKL